MAIEAIGATQVSVVAVTLFTLLVAGTLYVDDWFFDTGTREVTHRVGTLLVARSRKYHLSDIDEIRHYSRFNEGLNARFHRVAMVLKDEGEVVLEMSKNAGRQTIHRARTIASHLNVKFGEL